MTFDQASVLVAHVMSDGRCFFHRPGNTKGIPTRRVGDTADQFDKAMDVMGSAIRHLTVAGEDWALRGPDERTRAINRLRDAGYDLLTVIAGEQHRARFVSELRKTRFLQGGGERNVPWEFLYLGSREEPAELNNFFGANAAVGHPWDQEDDSSKLNQVRPLQNETPYSERPPGQPLISGLAEDRSLDSAKYGLEATMLLRRGLSPIRLQTLRGARKLALANFQSFLESAADLIHFNCHARAGTTTKTGSLVVTDEFQIDREEIAGLAISLDAVVVLNCCHGLTLRRDTRGSIASAFAGRGVRAVVGPTNVVADDFATLWADHFYHALLTGEPVSAAILSARKELFAQPDANPMALLYAFIGEYDAKLEQERAA
jgi:hypothetical protein